MATITRQEGKQGVSYKLTVSCGYDVHGKQKRYYRTWTPDPGMTARQVDKELQRQAVLFEEDCRQGRIADGSIKFEAFAKQWFAEYAEPTLKTRTIERYRQFAQRTYQAMGHLRTDSITTRTVQKFILNLGEDGINQTTEGRLSPKTIKGYLSFVSSIFAYAVAQGVATTNPCRGVRLPTMARPERDCYTLEEAQRFLALLEQEEPMWRCFFTLAIYGGFRRGELFGFEWSDLDSEHGVITVRRTSQYSKGRGVFTETPKTASSYRSLKLPDEALEMLRQFRAHQTQARLRVGDQWVDSDRIFTAWNGAPLNPNCTGNWLTRFCQRTGMRHVSMHSFRHLNASLLISGGTDVRTVSAVLGHAQTSTTLNIYAHAFAEAQARATEAVAASLQRTINAK